MLDESKLDFQVYRPEKPTGRLDGVYHTEERKKLWTPSVSYKYNIEDIRNQFTPAESYRHSLVTSGRIIRLIQKLEKRWNANLNGFIKAALRIQSLHRGNVSRTYFNTIKAKLYQDLHQRQTYTKASMLFVDKDFNGAILQVISHSPTTTDLQLIKMKSEYQLHRFQDCIQTSSHIIEMSISCEDAYYIQACVWLHSKDYSKAYNVLKQLAISIEVPRRDSYRLCAAVAAKVDPPKWLEVVDSLSPILKWNKHDFDILYDRASAYCCLQEWESAKNDLDVIIAFNPGHCRALLRRARLYACIRHWEQAKNDYMKVLINKPGLEEALRGLNDIKDTIINVPMINDSFLDNQQDHDV